MVSNPEREGFVRPARAAFSSTVSRRRRASACSDASTSFEPCRQVVDVLETTGRQLSSWHINTPGLSRRSVAAHRREPARSTNYEFLAIAHFVLSFFFFFSFFYSILLFSRQKFVRKKTNVLPLFSSEETYERANRDERTRSILRPC